MPIKFIGFFRYIACRQFEHLFIQPAYPISYGLCNAWYWGAYFTIFFLNPPSKCSTGQWWDWQSIATQSSRAQGDGELGWFWWFICRGFCKVLFPLTSLTIWHLLTNPLMLLGATCETRRRNTPVCIVIF